MIMKVGEAYKFWCPKAIVFYAQANRDSIGGPLSAAGCLGPRCACWVEIKTERVRHNGSTANDSQSEDIGTCGFIEGGKA